MLLAALIPLAVILPGRAGAEPAAARREAGVAAYRERLRAAADALEEARRAGPARPGRAGQALDRAAERLPETLVVVIPNGERVSVSFSEMRRDLAELRGASGEEAGSRIDALRGRLLALDRAAERIPAGDPKGRARAGAALKGVLARREFQTSRLDRSVDAFLRQLGFALAEALSSIGIPAGLARVVPWLLLACAAAAAAITLAVLLRRFLPARAREERAAGAQTGTRVAAPAPRSVESLLAGAEEHAAAGRYREAFRALYLALLLRLDRAGLIAYEESRTNWEYARALRAVSPPEASESFQAMTLLFDGLIYGRRPASAEDYHAGVERFRTLEGML